MGFVKNKMFPGSDFYWKRANYNTKDFALNRIKSITLLGRSEDFDLAIYDMTHESENDPKVSLTREAFKFMRQNVEASTLNALIIFKSNNSDNYRLSLLTTDPNNVGRKTEREISNPRRFSFYLGPDAKTKTPEQFLIKKGAISNLEDLKSRFSVEVVNKEFYSKIAELFYRFIDEAKYPNSDRKKFFAVKLIGRIIFCWFLKKKKSDAGKPLISEELLSLESLGKHQNYFHSVLEPLFFEVLNTPVEKRTSAALLQIEDFAKSIPFLNGGLFEPDDDDKYQGIATHGVIEIDDSWFHDLFELLEMYNFTINENTPVDVELSIDPEMLGRIFENLLAEINPETGESARKATGSFYTPREIVEYMVNESLKAYLLQKVEIDEETVDKLLNWSEEAPELSESQSNGILEALDKMKVLDPACGSGAFPMGILQKTALVLEKIDPQSKKWITKMVEKIPDSNLRKFVEDQLQKEDWSYVHKLGIIQKSIYGVDIQPIAVEISKLRFFLSLIIDSKIDDKAENRGVKPLPNLETKFVCANSLIGMEDDNNLFLIKNEEISSAKEQLVETRKAHFLAQTKDEKERIRANDAELRKKIFLLKIENRIKSDTKNLDMLLNWDPYKHNEIAPFFDPEWMFGVKYGFDIVIGNPPYISAPMQVANPKLSEQREKLMKSKRYKSLFQKWDLYIPFIELGIQLNKRNGICTMIVPFPLTNQFYAKVLRKMLVEENDMFELVDLNGTKVFENATVSNCIPFIRKASWTEKTWISNIDEKRRIHRIVEKPITELVQDTKTYVWNVTEEKRETNRHANMHVLGDFCYISKGMVLNSDENSEEKKFVKADLISEIQDEIHCRKFLEGKDCAKYVANKFRYLEYNTERVPDKCSRPTFRELYTTPKLMFNRLGELQVFFDEEGDFTTSDAMFVCVLWKDLHGVENKSITLSIKKFSTMTRVDMEKLSETVDLRYLLGIMNSKYAAVLLTNLRGGDYHIYPEHIRNIPIPEAMPEQQWPIIILVDYILFLKTKNQLPLAVSFFETVINSLVYDIYLEEKTDKRDLYVSDFVPKYLKSFETDMSDEDKLKLCEEVYNSMNDNDALSRAIINRKNLNLMKTIQGAENE